MKGLPFLLITALLLVTSSCNHKEVKEELKIDDSVKQLIFFTDNKQYEQEISYYDAIIELKRSYPELIKDMKVITAAEASHLSNYKVENCPAILLVYQDKVLVEIKGTVSKDKIINPLAKAMDEENENP
ncbi:MAG: small peptidoglycan-associated lipoprotein [Bacillota bacterium]|uniref:small peptidoglycan-associated lipoprotein n=1 Tax=Cytobacillus firmus TaxID=1399 RepID=UPI0015807AD0|nr:small peptidoglycan-associated lipoprotein [Cytobacillus firmus]MBG9654228.1 small peptidoglycan-associated lipoprotein [Cytobacillus firmus]MED1906999.1 small peptidoglycan-associated lipoprotein [Cytobacillus firmus]NUH82709.1 small peptidoglycan-associated lipoprotein [Cytobacillus firmus]